MNALDDIFRFGHGRIIGYRDLLTGKVDNRIIYAIYFLGIALDGRHAVGAGHAQHR